MHRFKLDAENPKAGRTDWARIDALSDEEVEAAALGDPDAQPVSDATLQRMRPVPNIKAIRARLGMAVEEFARTFHIAEARVRGWEAGTLPLLPSERVYLRAIDARPDVMRFVVSEIEGRESGKGAKSAPYYVVKSDNRWAVRKPGAGRSTSVHDTQRSAIDAARSLAKNQSVDLVVFGSDGQVRLRRRYSDSLVQSRKSA